MTNTTILLGSGPGAHAIRSNLIDLATLGLVSRFHWVDLADPSAEMEVIDHHETDGVVIVRRGVADALRTAVGSRVMLVALDEPDAQGSTVQVGSLTRWTNDIDKALTEPVRRFHLYLPRLPLPAQAPVVIPGCATLVLSPEDAESSSGSRERKYGSDGPDELAEYAAPALASLAGLWAGADRAPLLDGADGPMSTGEPGNVRLVRVFHRRVDTTVVEAEARRRTLDVNERMPQPLRSDNTRVIATGDDDKITEAVSRRFLDQAYRELVHQPVELPQQRAQQVQGWKAFTAFLKYFFRNAFTNPADIPGNQTVRVQRTFARAVQRTLYGEKSAVDVVCGRYDGNSPAVTMEGLAEASGSVRNSIAHIATPEEGLRLEAPPEAPGLWRLYVSTALTLADGTPRQGQIGPLDNRDNPMIVSAPHFIAGDVSDSFDGSHPILHELLGDRLASGTVEPSDPYGARAYANALEYASRQTTDRSVMELRGRFNQWRDKQSRSYSWRVAEGLMGIVDDAQRSLRESAETLAKLRGELEQVSGADTGNEARLRKTLRWLTALWAGLVIIIGYFCFGGGQPFGYRIPPQWLYDAVTSGTGERWGGLHWGWGLSGIFLTTLVILIVQMNVFAKAKREEHERTAWITLLEKQVDTAERNFSGSVVSMEAATQAYFQHQCWSAFIARAVSRPFGDDLDISTPLSIPHAGMPRSTVLAEATPDEQDINTAVNTLRDTVFQSNWAQVSFDSLLESGLHEARVRNEYLAETPSDLYGKRGDGNSPLVRLKDRALRSEVRRSGVADEAWSAALRNLSTDPTAAGLRTKLQVWEDGQQRPVTSTELFQGIEGGPNDVFAEWSLSAAGARTGGAAIDPEMTTVYRQPSADTETLSTLSQSMTHVQVGRSTFGGNLSGSGYAAATATDGGADEGVPSLPEAPSWGLSPEPAQLDNDQWAPSSPYSTDVPAAPDAPEAPPSSPPSWGEPSTDSSGWGFPDAGKHHRPE